MKPYYEHNGITIYCVDCREILPNVPRSHALVTDPPYGANYIPQIRRYTSHPQWCREADKAFKPINGDNRPFDPSHLLGFRNSVIFGGQYFAHLLPPSRSWLIWDKRVMCPPDDSADCEMAWTNLDIPARIFRHVWRGIVRWGEENVSTSGGKLHPNQKPVALMRWVLTLMRLESGDVIVDPYMGSGTTLLAAKREGLQAIGIDDTELYCEIAAKRLSQEVLNFGDTPAQPPQETVIEGRDPELS